MDAVGGRGCIGFGRVDVEVKAEAAAASRI